MGPERNRRLIAAVIVSILFMLSSWIDDYDDDTSSTSSSHGVKASVKSAARRLGKSLGTLDKGGDKDDRRKKTTREEEELYLQDEFEAFLAEENENEDEDEASYSKTFRSKSNLYIRTSSFHFDLHACLPKFICEIHAHHVSQDLTELEKDIIGLFRNYVVLEGPGSPVYTYQLAAHMGQLATGLEPSPCQNLYPSCPLSRKQLLEILKNVKTSRKMFY